MILPIKKTPAENQGFALVLVLCFIALLSIVVLAFFSNSALQRTVSDSSADQVKVDLFTQGAVDAIVGDLKQEIVAGSTAIPVYTNTNTVNGSSVTNYAYTPLNNSSAIALGAVPAISGFATNTGLENLVKISSPTNYAGSTAPYVAYFPAANAFPSNRATTNASTNSSLNGRFISMARWNKPLFIAPTSTNNFAPKTPFPAPNWILVDRSGNNPTTTNGIGWNSTNTVTTTVVGRYAYAIYNEGGVLDVNEAGYPVTNANSTNLIANLPYKNALPFADLTQLTNANGRLLLDSTISALIKWRNAATTKGGADVTGANYVNAVLNNQSGFMHPSSTNLYQQSQSDSMFASRQQLINFLSTCDPANANALNALPYLSTFARDLDQPSYAPDTNRPKILPAISGGNYYAPTHKIYDDLVNPNFQGMRVQNTFQRNNGTRAVVGEPLVKQRFALNRLAWLTYKGPSASRSTNDADMQMLMSNGISASYLQQGTASNIVSYFGLEWDAINNQWKYDVHNGATGKGPTGDIMMLGDLANLAASREPDFFELLKATINVGSLGKALLPANNAMPAEGGAAFPDQPFNYNYYLENSVDVQILRIGANIISQFQTANYPPSIVFNDGSRDPRMPTTIVGVSNLPYLNGIINGILQLQTPNPLPRKGDGSGGFGSGVPQNAGYQVGDKISAPGLGAMMQFPIVWNPHDPSSSVGAAGAGPTSFRVVADSASPDGGGQYSPITYAASKNYSGGNPVYSPTAGGSVTSDSSEIDFSMNNSTNQIFPEPALLMKSGSVISSGGNMVSVSIGASNSILANTNAINGGFTDLAQNSQIIAFPPPYIGILLGTFPMTWYDKGNTNTAPYSAMGVGVYVARNSIGNYQSCYLTYQLQYKDPLGKWVTYDAKYGKTFGDFTQFWINKENAICGCLVTEEGTGGSWAFPVDPRTSRFGLLWTGTYEVQGNGLNSPYNNGNGYYTYKPLPCYAAASDLNHDKLSYAGGWVDKLNGILLTQRPDSMGGWFAMPGWPFSGGGGSTVGKVSPPFSDGTSSGWMAWVATDIGTHEGADYPGLQPGVLAQNNADVPFFYRRFLSDHAGDGMKYTPMYFADPDGMVRRGMGAFVLPNIGSWVAPVQSVVGLPTVQVFPYTNQSASDVKTDNIPTYTNSTPPQVTSQAQSRPFMLHRPFRTVGELGYVFSDTPWRNLDLSTAESGNAALLDVFCIAENASNPGAVTDGKVDLNTRQVPVLQAILAADYLDPAELGSANQTALIDTNTAALLAQALVHRTTTFNQVGCGPLQNVSELVGKFVAKTKINDLGGKLSGESKGTLSSASSAGFYDGKLSYKGFSDQGWDLNNETPTNTSPALDVYSAYQTAPNFPTNSVLGTTLSTIQRFREAPIRALAASGQVRVWNLMIDVIAQTGRYPKNVSSISQFLVEGEQRYWVHLAIDRQTGQVIDKQVEIVKE